MYALSKDLMVAIQKKNIQLIENLLLKKANLNITNNKGKNCLHLEIENEMDIQFINYLD